MMLDELDDVLEFGTQEEVLKRFSSEISRRICGRAMKDLRNMNAANPQTESQLANFWEEICVQLQAEDWYFWDEYDKTAHSVVAKYVQKLRRHETMAIWFQTEEGFLWLTTPVASDEHFQSLDEGERGVLRAESQRPEISTADIVRYIVEDHLYRIAAEYSNNRIRRHLEQ